MDTKHTHGLREQRSYHMCFGCKITDLNPQKRFNVISSCLSRQYSAIQASAGIEVTCDFKRLVIASGVCLPNIRPGCGKFKDLKLGLKDPLVDLFLSAFIFFPGFPCLSLFRVDIQGQHFGQAHDRTKLWKLNLF